MLSFAKAPGPTIGIVSSQDHECHREKIRVLFRIRNGESCPVLKLSNMTEFMAHDKRKLTGRIADQLR